MIYDDLTAIYGQFAFFLKKINVSILHKISSGINLPLQLDKQIPLGGVIYDESHVRSITGTIRFHILSRPKFVCVFDTSFQF